MKWHWFSNTGHENWTFHGNDVQKHYLIFHPHHYHEMLITLTSTKKFKLYENSPILFKQVWSDGETNTLIDVPETRSSKNVTLHFEVPCIEGEMAPCVPVKEYNFESNCTKVKFITLPVKKSKMSNCTTLPLKKSHVKLYYIHLHWRKKSHVTCQIVLHLTDGRKIMWFTCQIALHLHWKKVTSNCTIYTSTDGRKVTSHVKLYYTSQTEEKVM